MSEPEVERASGGFIKGQPQLIPTWWHAECGHRATHPEPRVLCDYIISREQLAAIGGDAIRRLSQGGTEHGRPCGTPPEQG